MFDKPRYIQNSFTIVFPRQSTIRRKANEFEDRLKGRYFQPHIIPVPDDLDPEVPRMIFGSEHGFSQVIVSQVSLVLNVNYSPDWQVDIAKGQQYLLERAPVLFDLLSVLGEVHPYFCGLTTRVRLRTEMPDQVVLVRLVDAFLKDTVTHDLHEFQLKLTRVLSDCYYSNLLVQNYRSWNVENPEQSILRLPREAASERGIQIVGDFTDRYAFNQMKEYCSTKETAEIIVRSGLDDITEVIRRMEGVLS